MGCDLLRWFVLFSLAGVDYDVVHWAIRFTIFLVSYIAQQIEMSV